MGNGIYIAVKFGNSTLRNIENFIIHRQIPNPVSVDELHSTLIYSRVGIQGGINKSILAPTPKPGISLGCGNKLELDVWKQETSNVLVMKYQSEYMMNRHNELRQKYGFTHDYEEYVPHFTLSYDCGDFDHTTIKAPDYMYVMINREFQEELILDKIVINK